MNNKFFKILGISLLGGFLSLPVIGTKAHNIVDAKAADTITNSVSFGNTKVNGWDATANGYCSAYYGSKTGLSVTNTSISDFSCFKNDNSYSLKVWVTGFCNGGTNSVKVSTIKSDETVVNEGTAQTSKLGSGSSLSTASVKETGEFSFEPSSEVTGLKIDLGTKCCMTKIRWSISQIQGGTTGGGGGTTEGGGGGSTVDPSGATTKGYTFKLVKNVSDLDTGSQIAIGVKSKNIVAGVFTKDNLPGVGGTFSGESLTSDGGMLLTLVKSDSGFKINSSAGYIGTTAAKALSLNTETVWSISIGTNNSATISTGSYGKILYNCNSGTSLFKNYTSDPGTSMILPEIYKIETSGGGEGGDTPPAPTYTFTYNSNGGSGSLVDPSSPYASAASATVLENAFTAPSGKEFARWNTKADGTGSDYQPNDQIQMVGNVTLYAIWSNEVIQEGEYFELVTSVSSLKANDKVIFGAQKDASNYAINGDFNSKYLESVINAKSGNKIYLADGKGVPMTLGTAGGNWTFTIGGKLLATTSGADFSVSVSETANQYTISFDGDNAIITSTTYTTATVYYNASTPRFKTYTSTTQTPIQLYKKVGTVSKVNLDQDTAEVYENGSIQVKVSSCEGITPTSYAWAVTDGSANVQLTSGTTTNTVTVKGLQAGTATVEVTVNGTYKASCQVTVKSMSEALIAEGKYLVVSADGKHLMTSTVADTSVIDLTNMSNAWTFEFAYQGENTYYLKSDNGYLVKTGSQASMLGLSEAKSSYFTATGSATDGFVLTLNNSTRAIGPGDDGKWRAIEGSPKVFLKSEATYGDVGYKGTLVTSTYNVGDTFDPKGLSFYYTYQGDTTEYPIDIKDISWDAIAAGTTATGKVTVCGAQRTITVTGLTITNYQPDHLEFSGSCKTEYFVGESVDLTGLTITLVSKDGTLTKSDVLTSEDYTVSPHKIGANTTAITVTLKENTSITKSFDITKKASTYVVANYVKPGDRIVIATLDSDAYGINGGEELSFTGETPSHTSYSYAPAGLEEFVVESTSFGSAVALKNTKTDQYLQYNSKKFGYPENSSITVNGSASDGYDFKYYVEIEGTEMYLNLAEGSLDEDGSIVGLWGYDVIDKTSRAYVTSECLLDASTSEGSLSYIVYSPSNGWTGTEYSVDLTWEMNGATPVIYLPTEGGSSVTENAAWDLSFNKTSEMWEIVPYSNQDVHCSYNPDGTGNFGFYAKHYYDVVVYRNNSIALANTVTSISLDTSNVKTEYNVNDRFEWTESLTVTAFYSGGISSVVPLGGYDISIPDMTTEGEKTVTVTYGALENTVSKSFTINVKVPEPPKPTIDHYEITTAASKLVYYVGETVVFDGAVSAVMSDSSVVALASDDYSVNLPGTVSAGEKTVTINIKNSGGKYLQYKVTVVEAPVTLDSITVSGQTTEFFVGVEFEFDGVLTAHYSNNTTSVVTPSQFNEFDMNTAGTKEVIVYYTEGDTTVNVSYNITVKKEPVITEVTLSNQKTSFTIGDSFDKGGLVVTCKYDDGTSKTDVPYSIDSTNFKSNEEGTYTISVSVSGYVDAVTYEVTVRKAPINEIVLKYESSKDDAQVGDEQELFFKKPTDANVEDFNYVSSDETIATVEIRDGHVYVQYLAQGTCTITVTPKDSIGGKGKAVYTVLVKLFPNSVSIDESCEVNIGGQFTLTPTFDPVNATETRLTYSSSDESVAKVSSSGVITGVSVGTATITASCKNSAGETISSSCTVTVFPTAVTGVTLNKQSTELTVGKTETLKATVNPADATDKSVIWSSSDESVATVSSSGVVTAKAVGEATITVETVDGGFKATCLVVVKPVNVTGVSISRDGSGDVKVGETVQLSAVITPSDATDKTVVWTSLDEAIATVDDNGLVTANAEGTVTILCSTNDGNIAASIDLSIVNNEIIEPDTPEVPEKDKATEEQKLAPAAVVGIAVGSTAAAGGIGYGVFAVLKKTGKIKIRKHK